MQRTGEALHKARRTQKNQAPKNGGPAGAKTITNANSTEGGQRNAAVLEGLQSWHVRSGTKRGRKGYLRFGHERSIRVHHDRQRLTLSAPTAPPKAPTSRWLAAENRGSRKTIPGNSSPPYPPVPSPEMRSDVPCAASLALPRGHSRGYNTVPQWRSTVQSRTREGGAPHPAQPHNRRSSTRRAISDQREVSVSPRVAPCPGAEGSRAFSP